LRLVGSFGFGPLHGHGSALSQNHVVIAAPRVNLPRKQAIRDDGDGIEQSGIGDHIAKSKASEIDGDCVVH
jgi:hypothetical protein